MKGCPLSCVWCHNPESRALKPQKIKKELKLDGKTHCSEELVGREMTVAEVMKEISKDILFYEESEGGATFSGGEVFLQENFLISLLEECRKSDINTCVDTTGYVNKSTLERVMPLTDTFLYDVKLLDNKEHIKYCGVPNEPILDNLRFLYNKGSDIRVRFPVIPTITDTEANLEALAGLMTELKGVPLDLLPYHKIGKDKYRRLGMEFHMEGIEKPSEDRMEFIKKFFIDKGVDVKIGG